MLLKLIIALLVFTVAKRPRCPNKPPKFGMPCTKRLLTCKYLNRCYCSGKFRKLNYYRCGPKKRWGIKRARRCPKCLKGCACESIKPSSVCSSDGKNFANLCSLRCAKKKYGCPGRCPCKTSCHIRCPQKWLYFQPLCGTNRKSYNNFCDLKCDRTSIRCKGKCPCPRARPKITKRKREKGKPRWGWRVKL